MSASVPSVAVVLPVYDVAPYVDAALASLADQTHPADEVIVVDDASNDDTADRVERWQDRLPLTLIRLEQNVGCGMARAIAVRQATAEVIAPFDGDDVWLPHHLEATLPLVTPDTIAATKPLLWDGTDRGRTPAWHPIPAPEAQANAIVGKNFLFSHSLYWRSTMLDRAGGPSERRRAEDRENWIRLLGVAGCHAVAAPEPTVLYRVRDESLSANEGSLDGVIEILADIRSNPALSVDAPILDRSLRRLRARRRFLDALDLACDGDTAAARRQFLTAAWEDRSLRGGTAPAEQGSITLRALAALVAPRILVERRRRRRPVEPKREAEAAPLGPQVVER